MTIKIFEVGGSIRDSFLGIENKDFDFSVEAPSFEAMLEYIERTHEKIFVVKPEFLTVRARDFDGKAKDYVMCRKDGAYSDRRRPNVVEIGTLFDDLARRDFTINAIARDVETGNLIDPHGGVADLEKRILRAVGSAEARFREDPLRMLRAIRFAITKSFRLSREIEVILQDPDWAEELRTVSNERIREELQKCFKYDTVGTLLFLQNHCSPFMLVVIFDETGIWLKPTLEQK